MNNDYKKLFEASERARKLQESAISSQNAIIANLEAQIKELHSQLDRLSADYDHALALCTSLQELLDRIFKEHPDL